MADNRASGPAGPTLDEAITSLDGCSTALTRLMDAVHELFACAGQTEDRERYPRAVDELRDAHAAAVDWCTKEARRYGS